MLDFGDLAAGPSLEQVARDDALLIRQVRPGQGKVDGAPYVAAMRPDALDGFDELRRAEGLLEQMRGSLVEGDLHLVDIGVGRDDDDRRPNPGATKLVHQGEPPSIAAAHDDVRDHHVDGTGTGNPDQSVLRAARDDATVARTFQGSPQHLARIGLVLD